MPKVDEAAILKRAKNLSEQDGSAWDLPFYPVKPKGASITLAHMCLFLGPNRSDADE